MGTELVNYVESGTWSGTDDAWVAPDVTAASVVVHGPGDLKSSPELTKGRLETSCTIVGIAIFIYWSSVGDVVEEWLLANRKTCSSKVTSREIYTRFVHGTVAYEDTLKGTIIEFGSVVGPEVGPTRTPKNFKLGVCGWSMHESF
jgi:hypothetical protein